MSEINIKNTGQLGLNTAQSVKSGEQNKALGIKKVPVDNNVPSSIDSVSLTDRASQLSALKETVVNSSEVDSGRVEALRASIADGSYQVDAAELAKNMSHFETQLR